MLASRWRQSSDDEFGENWGSSPGTRNSGTAKVTERGEVVERAEVHARRSGSDESRVRCR